MALERKIECAPDGSAYSNRVSIFYEDINGRRFTFDCDPDGLYGLMHRAIVQMMQGGATEDMPEGMTLDMWNLRKNLAKLMKVGIKGLLLMWGNDLLTVAFGTKEHPKPPKGVDLLEWYQDMFARIGIAYLMKNDTVLRGNIVHEDEQQTLIAIHEITTRPITASEGPGIRNRLPDDAA